jgi:hypothetical protein
MDRPVSGRKRSAELLQEEVTPKELEIIKQMAHSIYVDAGQADVAWAWVQAVDLFLTSKRFNNNTGKDSK